MKVGMVAYKGRGGKEGARYPSEVCSLLEGGEGGPLVRSSFKGPSKGGQWRLLLEKRFGKSSPGEAKGELLPSRGDVFLFDGSSRSFESF